jgi:Mg-chelatase subunit ChlD
MKIMKMPDPLAELDAKKLAIMKQERMDKVIEAIAKKSELIKNFNEVRVFAKRGKPLAYVDMSDNTHNTLYINMDSEIMEFPKLIANIEGLIIHEQGHLDKRLAAPETKERAMHNFEHIKKKKIEPILLNFAYDMEVHFQYNRAKMIKPIQQIKLKKMLTEIRNYAFEKDKTDLILSLNYEITEEQKAARKIIENRSLTILQKAEKINNLIKKSPNSPKATSITEVIQESDYNPPENGKGKKQSKATNQRAKELREIMENADYIKDEVERRAETSSIRDRLAAMGFSDAEINEALERKEGKLLSKIKDLEKSIKTLLVIDRCTSKEKTKERTESSGHRLNGYHKIQDIREAVNNVEDLMTTGKYDFSEILIPTKVQRKNMGIMVVLRDTSGSIGEERLQKIVRDTTVGLIKLAKDGGHKIGVIDFHSAPEPVYDSKGNIFTTEYNRLMLDSMAFKMGYSTLLSEAMKLVNKTIEEKGMTDIPINIFIISDGFIERAEKMTFASKKYNLIGICAQETDGKLEKDDIPQEFMSLIENNKGKIFGVNRDMEDFWLELLKDFAT